MKCAHYSVALISVADGGCGSNGQIDTLTASWATQRISGVAYPISPTYSTQQVVDLLKSVRAKALFTSWPLHDSALEAASSAGIPRTRVYLLPVPTELSARGHFPADLTTVDQAITRGLSLSPLPSLRWSSGQGARQTAFLCSSSEPSRVSCEYPPITKFL